MVEEQSGGAIRINQPAGHLEPGESLLDAVVREALEESARVFAPTALVGTYLSRNVASSRGGMSVTYLRFAFAGSVGEPLDRVLDEGILRTVWMTRDELATCTKRHRSPLVLRCVDDYLRGQRAPLELVHADPSAIGSLADH
jgi:8-oxo-dGTP pyrophosphatase MutT (NUDIX family)